MHANIFQTMLFIVSSLTTGKDTPQSDTNSFFFKSGYGNILGYTPERYKLFFFLPGDGNNYYFAQALQSRLDDSNLDPLELEKAKKGLVST